MKVIIFGATGMVGQGVLIECLRDPGVDAVVCVGRNPPVRTDPKLHNVVVADAGDLSGVAGELSGYDACFFCLGVSSAGMSEELYRRLTYDLTLGAARTLAARNPQMTFVYVSGTGTDSTEHGRVMWARVKGATENALLKLPFKAAYMFRPSVDTALKDGGQVANGAGRWRYDDHRPVRRVAGGDFFPNEVSTTSCASAGRCSSSPGAPKTLLEPADIERLVQFRGGLTASLQQSTSVFGLQILGPLRHDLRRRDRRRRLRIHEHAPLLQVLLHFQPWHAVLEPIGCRLVAKEGVEPLRHAEIVVLSGSRDARARGSRLAYSSRMTSLPRSRR